MHPYRQGAICRPRETAIRVRGLRPRKEPLNAGFYETLSKVREEGELREHIDSREVPIPLRLRKSENGMKH